MIGSSDGKVVRMGNTKKVRIIETGAYVSCSDNADIRIGAQIIKIVLQYVRLSSGLLSYYFLSCFPVIAQ